MRLRRRFPSRPEVFGPRTGGREWCCKEANMNLRKFSGIFRLVTIALFGAALAGAILPAPALAADKVNFTTVWFAQAEHGGYYQAKATGLYDKAGLDVTIRQGGPQISSPQLLLAGEADII